MELIFSEAKDLDNLSIVKSSNNFLNDEASIEFNYKGFKFDLTTPLSDYWVDKPVDCPSEIFNEIILHLQDGKL